MKKIESIKVFYDEMFVDKMSISLLYNERQKIIGYYDDNLNPLTVKEVTDWVLGNHYNIKEYYNFCYECKGRKPEDEVELYQNNENYRVAVDEERLYILYLIGIPVTEIANIFKVSRQTVYNRIKMFEEKRLHEFMDKNF